MQVLHDNVSEKKGSVDQTPKEAELQKNEPESQYGQF